MKLLWVNLQFIINQTNNRRQCPNCYATADGKNISIMCPKNSGPQFYNYKGFFNIPTGIVRRINVDSMSILR